MTGSIRDTLPPAHRRVLPTVFDRPAVHESLATCDDCAMCDRGGGKDDGRAVHFRRDLKCCTYHPALPNFLVGAILADPSPELAEGKRRVRARIEARIGVTPEWLAPPRKQRVLLEASRATSFGRSKALLCPYFDHDGRCTIWRHREAVCSTFFCKHDAGAVGDAFWTATKRLLVHAEITLARAAARSLSRDVAEPTIGALKLTPEDLEDQPPREEEYRAFWAEWTGREEAFYVACHAYVSALGPADLVALFDAEERAGPPAAAGRSTRLVLDLVARHDALTRPAIAERLVPNPDMRLTTLEDGVATTTYSAYDAQWLSEALYDVVKEFNPGESVAETRARLRRDRDLEIPDALLLSLQQHEILVPPPAR
jgi:hypothetical protein